jgi:hypothetical protein
LIVGRSWRIIFSFCSSTWSQTRSVDAMSCFYFLLAFCGDSRTTIATSIYRDRWDYIVISFLLYTVAQKLLEEDISFRVLVFFSWFIVVCTSFYSAKSTIAIQTNR